MDIIMSDEQPLAGDLVEVMARSIRTRRDTDFTKITYVGAISNEDRLKRGLITALVDLGDSDRLQVIASHFHHVEGDSGIRQIQAVATVEAWDGQARTVLLGDLNAEPDAPEMNILRRAGLVDPMAGIEPPPRYTWPSDDPTVRIDYIWVSPDLTVANPLVLATTASDHMPVVGEIGR